MSNREDHGYNSPSQIWANKKCPGRPNKLRSLVLTPLDENDGDKKGSIPARRGTWQHEAVKPCFDGKKWHPSKELAVELEITETQLEHVEWCADQVREVYVACTTVSPYVSLIWEHQMDLSSLGIDGGKDGCRADVVIVVPGHFTVVIDFKFGFKWVPGPGKNPQFQAYTCGVYEEFGGELIWNIKLQPTLFENQVYLEHRFREDEIEACKQEIISINEACANPEAELCRGDHCGFCPAYKNSACEQWSNTFLEVQRNVSLFEYMSRLSAEEAGDLYSKMKDAKKYADNAVKIMQAWAFKDREKNILNGYEIGPGKCKNDWSDPEDAKAVIRELCKEKGKKQEDVLDPPQKATPKSPYNVFKVLGKSKAVRERLEPLVISTPGNETIKKVRK